MAGGVRARLRTGRPGGPELAVAGEAAPVARVSVIIPAHNAAETIAETLDSVASQAGVDWEAIVVDDGSTDHTASLVADRAEHDPRVRLIRKSNGGVSSARNAGLAVARGEWVCFLDSDDWLAPRALEQLLSLAEADPECAVAAGSAARVTPGGHTWPYQTQDLSDPFLVFSFHCALVVHAALVRRTAVTDLGGFDEGLSSSEDWDLWQRLARAGHRFVQTDALVALYRARPGSLSRRLPQAAQDGLEVLRRGHAPDPRTPNAVGRYSGGAPQDALPHHRLHYVLWSAARDVASGGDGLATVSLIADDKPIDFEPAPLAELMASGMADMLVCRTQDLAPRWGEFGPKLQRVLAGAPCAVRLKAITLAEIRARLNGAQTGDPDVLRLDAPSLPAPQEGSDFATLQLRDGRVTLGAIAVPMLGVRTGKELAEVAASQVRRIPLAQALRASRPWRNPSFWPAAARAALDPRKLGLKSQFRNRDVMREILKERARHALATGLQATVKAKLAPLARQGGASAHEAAFAELRMEADSLPRPEIRSTDLSEHADDPGGKRPDQARRAEAWDNFFEDADPWNYGASAYELTKYEDTLELIPNLPDGEALELACAEGHFTVNLAKRVGSLLATDISVNALDRAADRCHAAQNVSFKPLDFMQQPLPGTYDLIVCSEVLYYAGAGLRQVAERIAGGLRPGGLLVMAHANQIADEPNATGFDWGHEHGSRSISDVFSSTVGLNLEHEIRRPLYRVQAFRKSSAEAAAPAPRVTHRALDIPLEPAVARNVVWGGGESRVAMYKREVTTNLPILMYHRVAPHDPSRGVLNRYSVTPEAFEAQMSFLRRQGYWSVKPQHVAEALAENRPLSGRAVMITFDDGYEDFAREALPILEKHDFTATLFVVAGKVGGAADWDAEHGAPAPLMGWDLVAEMARRGICVESHAQTHRPLTRLDVKEVYREFLHSRALIEGATGRAPSSICYPFGALDPVVEQAAQDCGFQLGFSTSSRVARLRDNPLRLPRVEVSGYDDLAVFARKLGHDLSKVTDPPRSRPAGRRTAWEPNGGEASIAVIVPARDAARTIARAVRSALAQPQASQVVVVDRGSQDETAAIARACDDGTGRLSVIQQPLGEVGAALNAGIAFASAPYVCWLDAQDAFLPGRLDDIWRAAGRDWDLVADMRLLGLEADEDGPLRRWRRDEIPPVELDFCAFLAEEAKPGAELSQLRPIIRRSFLEARGLRFDEDLPLGEAYVFMARALAMGARFRRVGGYGYVAMEGRPAPSRPPAAADLHALLRAHETLGAHSLSKAERAALRRGTSDLRRRWLQVRGLEQDASEELVDAQSRTLSQKIRRLVVGGLGAVILVVGRASWMDWVTGMTPMLAAA